MSRITCSDFVKSYRSFLSSYTYLVAGYFPLSFSSAPISRSKGGILCSGHKDQVYTSLAGTPPGSVWAFSLKSFSAPCQTGAVALSLRASRLGSKASLKASEDSRGSAEGRWSIEMTDNLGPLPSTGTSTVGLSNVVLML